MELDTNPLTQEVTEDPPSAALVLPEPSMTSLATIEALTNAILLANEQERVKFVTSIVRQVRGGSAARRASRPPFAVG